MDRLRRLRPAPTKKPAELTTPIDDDDEPLVARPAPPGSLEELVPGAVVENAAGRCYVQHDRLCRPDDINGGSRSVARPSASRRLRWRPSTRARCHRVTWPARFLSTRETTGLGGAGVRVHGGVGTFEAWDEELSAVNGQWSMVNDGHRTPRTLLCGSSLCGIRGRSSVACGGSEYREWQAAGGHLQRPRRPTCRSCARATGRTARSCPKASVEGGAVRGRRVPPRPAAAGFGGLAHKRLQATGSSTCWNR